MGHVKHMTLPFRLPNRVLTCLFNQSQRIAGRWAPQTRRNHVLASPDLTGFAQHLKDARNIVVLAGAGMSTGAGLPDFRTPGTGLYARLKEHGLQFPEEIFDINLFRNDPRPFYSVGKDLMARPELYQPTLAHYFIRRLSDQGRLLRLFTQNVDGLEYLAGIPDSRVVAAHGSFRGGHCAGSDTARPCGFKVDAERTRKITLSKDISDCFCPKCHAGYIKPDIVFFGENLPEQFWYRSEVDLPKADALIVMGTSLQVYPFAGLVDEVPIMVPRLLINKTVDGPFAGLPFKRDRLGRDAVFQGSCDEGVELLSHLCGFGRDELLDLAKQEQALVKEWGEQLASKAAAGEDTRFWDGLPWLEGKEDPGVPKPNL